MAASKPAMGDGRMQEERSLVQPETSQLHSVAKQCPRTWLVADAPWFESTGSTAGNKIISKVTILAAEDEPLVYD